MTAPSGLNPSFDASNVRRLLERQPACLMRVRLDGVLLACNRAALGLFGIDARRAVVSTNLIDRIVVAQRTQWQEFMRRCWDNGAASFECALVIRNDETRQVLVQGVALKDHPDGFESLLLHLCDQSQTQPLEHSILSAAIDGLHNEELIEALEAQSADRQRREAQFVELQKKLEESQLASLQKEREYGRDVAMLKSALAGAQAAKTSALAEKHELEALKLRLQTATAEQVRLQALLAEYEIDRTRIAAAHAEEQTREQDRVRAEHQRALVDLQAGTDAALADLRSQLARMSAEQRSLAERVEVAERERDSLIAGHRRALADMQTRNREMEELRAEQVGLQALLAEYEIDRTRIAAGHAEEQAREQDRMRAQHQRALVDLQASHDAALSDLRSQLARTSAEQGGLTERVEVAERELDLLRAEHERVCERLIAERHQALADVETAKAEAVAGLRSQLSQAFAEQRRLATRADEQELELDRLRAEHCAALTDVETRNREAVAEMRSELARRAAEHTRIRAERAAADERNRMSAEHRLAIADLQASKEAAAAEFRSQLSAALAEHHRLTSLLEDADRERERIAEEHGRTIADVQASKHETVAECERVLAEVQRALLVKDTSRAGEVERRASLQRGLTLAFSRMHAVLKDGPAPKEPFEAEDDALERPGIETIDSRATASAGDERLEDADLLHEPFDGADDAFVHELLEGLRATARPENLPDSKTIVPAQAVSAMPAPAAGNQPADDLFDAQDAAFALDLMDTHSAPRESVDQAGAEPPQDVPQAQPTDPKDS